ncbi:PHP domain-containing protein [Thecamonas trahens ATCC 50062]|uniref:PHP domain-containing protein n=1 Tax=Thecamonas trahens ATCC 50062 TaxID=461836 RepID=A0A0L0DDZ6_THETB|nr:PHP domain-containing protein [Thecamonas trahens ATCC 50062]KNC49543.1 PHP domain-containing protein [Thecamonas trahens ATCC 50062]|eukprot:XP_013757655.1 PHP domain-containing protein [Thecamonas trahens ATCC 50062]
MRHLLRKLAFACGSFLGPLCCRLATAAVVLALALAAGTYVLQRGPALVSYASVELAPPRNSTEVMANLTAVDEVLVGSMAVALNHSTAPVVLVDGHAHTTASDGRMSLHQLAAWEASQGFDAFFVTDHNVYGPEAAEMASRSSGVLPLAGQEYTTCRAHLNIYGVAKRYEPISPFPTNDELKELITDVHAAGGLVSVNHLPWSAWSMPLASLPSRAQWHAWGADMFEVVNSGIFDWETFIFARRAGMGVIAGTDVHSPYTRAASWTAIRPANLSAAAILDELRRARTNILLEAVASPRHGLYPVVAGESWTRAGMVWWLFTALGAFAENFYTLATGQYDFAGGFCTPTVFRLHTTLIGYALLWIVGLAAALELCCCGCAAGRCARPSPREPYALACGAPASSARCRLVPLALYTCSSTAVAPRRRASTSSGTYSAANSSSGSGGSGSSTLHSSSSLSASADAEMGLLSRSRRS